MPRTVRHHAGAIGKKDLRSRDRRSVGLLRFSLNVNELGGLLCERTRNSQEEERRMDTNEKGS